MQQGVMRLGMFSNIIMNFEFWTSGDAEGTGVWYEPYTAFVTKIGAVHGFCHSDRSRTRLFSMQKLYTDQ